MRLFFLKIYDTLSDSFWFLPVLMALVAGGSALGLVTIDHEIGSDWMKDLGWVWSGGADGARGVLSVIAGSVMTVVSIVFSLTITALAQTSSHFGPRVLRNFTSDRGVQFTLGTFISTFVYCLLVLRTVRSVEESSFVPYLAVNIGVALALASLVVLIFFIHHISQSIQAENLIANVGRDFETSLRVIFPQRVGQPKKTSPPDFSAPSDSDWKDALRVDADDSGYLQRVDDDELMQLATQNHWIIKMGKRPGDFVAKRSALVRVLGAAELSSDMKEKIRGCFNLGRHRTPNQDVLYSIQQLAEIASHALSPGINEPYTAITCIDWLGASLRSVAQRDLPSPLRADKSGKLRLVADPIDFDLIVRASFDQIRIYGSSNPEVMLKLLEIITEIAPDLHREQDREILMQHARLIGEDAAQVKNRSDRSRVEHRLHKTLIDLAEQKIEN